MKLAEARTPLLTVLIAGVLVFGGVITHGQRPQGGGGGGGAMVVDFTAASGDGTPVSELAPADITVKVGGKPRTVSELTRRKISAPAAGSPAGAAAAPAATSGPLAPFSTNEASAAPPPVAASSGRYFLIVVDTESLSPGAEPVIKTAIEGLLKDLTPADRVAFSLAPHDTAQLGFGTSLSVVRQAVANLRGQKPVIANTDDATAAALCRASDTLNLTKALMQQGPGGDTPVSMIVIAGSLSTPGTASSKASTGTTCNVQADQYNSLAAASAAGRVNLYVVQGDPNMGGRDPGLENLAGVTGAGATMRVTGDGFAPRVLADSSSYWVATLAPDPADKPNQSQRLELKAVKEGVTVHTRPEIMMARAANAAGPAPAGKAGATVKDMIASIASSATYTDLQMRAYAFAQRGAGDRMNVLVQAEPIDPAVKITAMSVGFVDSAGKPGSLPAPQLATYPITTVLPLGVGQYKIRVAATDSTGKTGAVDLKLDTAPIPAGPFKLSGLMLLAQNDKGQNSPKLQFSSTDKVTALFEMYGIITSAEMLVGFEIAPSENAPATKQFRPGSAPTQEPDKVQIFAEIPIAGLAPGDYVIRGIVQQKGSDMGRTIRTLRIVK